MEARTNSGLVLAVHPTSRGFGWALFEGPGAPVDWGIATAKVKRSATSMRRFQALLEQYRPSLLVLESFKGDETRRGARIQELAGMMKGSAANRDIEVAIYPRDLIGLHVAQTAHANRHVVARAVAKRIPILRMRLPDERSLWDSEDRRQCLFDAVALGLTHYSVSRPG